jgi:hypothetical protein
MQLNILVSWKKCILNIRAVKSVLYTPFGHLSRNVPKHLCATCLFHLRLKTGKWEDSERHEWFLQFPYYITILSVNLFVRVRLRVPPNNFWTNLLNSAGRSCNWMCSRRQSFNPISSIITKWMAFKVLSWMQNFIIYRITMNVLLLISLQRMDKCVCQDHLREEPKYEHRGRLEVKIHIMFYGGKS